MGPYTVEQINEYLSQGTLLPTDYAWHEGLPDWVPVTEISGVGSAAAPPPFNPKNLTEEPETKSKEQSEKSEYSKPCVHCGSEYDHSNNKYCPDCDLPEFITYGNWICPRCGAKDDIYEGTELVSKSGPRVSQEIGGGVYSSVGSNRVSHEAVIKCKQCDTILDVDRNYHKSPHEIKLRQVKLAKTAVWIAIVTLLFTSGVIALLENIFLGIIGLAAGVIAIRVGSALRADKEKFKIKKTISSIVAILVCLFLLFLPIAVFIVPKMKSHAADTLGPGEELSEWILLLFKVSDLLKNNILASLALLTIFFILFWVKEISVRKMPFKSDD
jgi:hypothetical protein